MEFPEINIRDAISSFNVRVKAYWHLMIVCLGGAVGGLVLAYIGYPEIKLMVYGGVIIAAAGLFGFYLLMKREPGVSMKRNVKQKGSPETKHGDKQKDIPNGGDTTETNPANSFNIYHDATKFEYVPTPCGVPWRLTNNGKEYHVHIVDKDTNELSAWELPDNDASKRHYDPREFANVVSLPCTKLFMEWTPSPFQKIAFGVMVGVSVLLAILLVVFSG